tara:strand:+ start:937 stop:1161 length:225 start_codon:yes stop_codon:yes gene_type:complete
MEYRILELLKDIKKIVTGQNRTDDRWLDIKEASQYCAVSPTTLRRNVKRGTLSASTTTGKMLFRASELESWLNG